MEHLDLWDAARKLLEDNKEQHVYIGVMHSDGSFRSLRSSELAAGDVADLVKQIKNDPSHHMKCNMQEVTSTVASQSLHAVKSGG